MHWHNWVITFQSNAELNGIIWLAVKTDLIKIDKLITQSVPSLLHHQCQKLTINFLNTKKDLSSLTSWLQVFVHLFVMEWRFICSISRHIHENWMLLRAVGHCRIAQQGLLAKALLPSVACATLSSLLLLPPGATFKQKSAFLHCLLCFYKLFRWDKQQTQE